jgi:hypothetical protein
MWLYMQHPSQTTKSFSLTPPPKCNILSCIWSVTIDGFWIDDRIYWTLWYSAWLLFTVHCYTHTNTPQCPQSRLHCCCLAAASNGGRSPSSGFPKCHRPQVPASHSNSSQRLNPSRPLTHSLTHSLTKQLLTDSSLILAPNLSCLHLCTDSAEKTLPIIVVTSCCRGIVAFVCVAEPLPSNGCCIVTRFTVGI